MAKDKSQPARVGIDSCVVLAYLIGDQPRHGEGIRQLFFDVEAKEVRLYGSTLLLAEVLGGGFKAKIDPVMERRIDALLQNPDALTLVSAGVQVGLFARQFRREYGLKVADAIHLASAVFARVDVFVTTNDKDFPIGDSVQGVQVDYPRSLGPGYLPNGG